MSRASSGQTRQIVGKEGIGQGPGRVLPPLRNPASPRPHCLYPPTHLLLPLLTPLPANLNAHPCQISPPKTNWNLTSSRKASLTALDSAVSWHRPGFFAPPLPSDASYPLPETPNTHSLAPFPTLCCAELTAGTQLWLLRAALQGSGKPMPMPAPATHALPERVAFRPASWGTRVGGPQRLPQQEPEGLSSQPHPPSWH